DIFKTLIRRPYGLFLVTGPTGSGKTTSLYAALNYVKDEETNIITCEDPVEYNIDGISQSQVNSKIGLTFAAQLRSILRQDPDVVLVGEIRDQETAETAIRASMTGHLVFSTLHCNDAPSAVPRLLDMGIDPYLLSTSLIGVMGQRLLRVTCPECRTAYSPSVEEQGLLSRMFVYDDVETLYEGKGCLNCAGTGFKGRMAVHEIMPVTQEVGSMIAGRPATEKLAELAAHYGYKTMQQDAMERVLSGRTSLKEAQRLLAFDDIPRVA
ncbi:MAG: GspE/PulE family protein, partial [Fimbriimonadaceae bacterium]|nr:GspE/PulE family protein [Fimbriimonadaceae bacterium]